MFTGIVSERGTVERLEHSGGLATLTLAAPATADGLEVGDSVAVNGVCLTVVRHETGRFEVEVVGETMARTAVGELEAGSAVNLERPLSGTGRFDGHIVQGHVDGIGQITGMELEGDARRVRIRIDPSLSSYVVEKGSITVDGVSLTITAVSAAGAAEAWFEIVLIPHTLDVTILGERGVGDSVNLEADILAKYVERMMEHRT